MPLGVVLATLGVAVSVGVVACVAHFVLGLDWQISVLLGAVTSPTDCRGGLLRTPPGPDPAAAAGCAGGRVRSERRPDRAAGDAGQHRRGRRQRPAVLRRPGRLRAGGRRAVRPAGRLARAVGLLRRVALGSAGLYPLAIVSLAVISYAGGTVLLHVSGFAAVYVTSLVLGRAELPHRMATRSFVDGFAWLAQIGLFVMLGLLASPGRIRLDDVLRRAGDRDRGDGGRAVRGGGAVGDAVQDAVERADLHRLGRAARRGTDRAGDHPAGREGAAGGSGLRRGVRPGDCCSRCCRGRRCRGWPGG